MKLSSKQKHMISECLWALVGVAFTTGFVLAIFFKLTN